MDENFSNDNLFWVASYSTSTPLIVGNVPVNVNADFKYILKKLSIPVSLPLVL